MTMEQSVWLLLLLPALSSAIPLENGVLHLPIVRRNPPAGSGSAGLRKRGTQSAEIGLGNFFDVTYQVQIKVGSVQTPLILDTGSSDLWVISDQCTGNCTAPGTPEYPQASFQPEAGLDVDLRYGDSRTGTSAQGLIGRDAAALAGLSTDRQVFAAINKTDTAMDQVGAAGIFGLGFPINSVYITELFAHDHPEAVSGGPSEKRAIPPRASNARVSVADRLPGVVPPAGSHEKRQSGRTLVDALLESYSPNGPLVSRLVLSNSLARPLVAITLNRNTIDIGGNEGLLSLGALPPGISESDLTWAPVRLYTTDEGGIPGPTAAPDEVYPIAWEVPLDGVYLNGQKLPDSALTPSGISLSALVDTGNSLMRGPEDVVQSVLSTIATSRDGTFPCASPPTMEFGIGGKRFPIDPRDFISQAFERDTESCAANLVATDPPGRGFLYSWSIGDPLLRSALVVYYYGNITNPSVDPPRIGFLSTVPANANALLQAAINNAGNGNFPATVNEAPTGAPAPGASTGVGGVPQATGASGGSSGGTGGSRSAAERVGVSGLWVAVVVGLVGAVMGL